MMQVYKYDENYIYESLLYLKTVVRFPIIAHQLLLLMVFIFQSSALKQKVVESASEEYIDSLKPLDPEPSEVEKVKNN